MKWEKVKLGSILSLEYGKPLVKEDRNELGKYKVYASGGYVGNHNECLIAAPTIVVGRKGSIGSITYSNDHCWVIDTAYYVKPKENINLRYLFYALSQLDLASLNKAAAVPGLNRNDVYEKRIPLPPLHIQEQIADTLDKVDALRKKDQELLQKYDELAQTIFYDMFGDPETNPKKWPCLTLEEITYKLGDGLHGTPVYDENGDYYFINGNNLIDGKITVTQNTKKVSFAEFSKHKKDLNKDSILVSINGTIGKVAFYDNEKIILGKSACYFNINRSKVVPQYIYNLISSPYFIKYATSEATGSTIKNVSLRTMRNLIVPIPPLSCRKRLKVIYHYKRRDIANSLLE